MDRIVLLQGCPPKWRSPLLVNVLVSSCAHLIERKTTEYSAGVLRIQTQAWYTYKQSQTKDLLHLQPVYLISPHRVLSSCSFASAPPPTLLQHKQKEEGRREKEKKKDRTLHTETMVQSKGDNNLSAAAAAGPSQHNSYRVHFTQRRI